MGAELIAHKAIEEVVKEGGPFGVAGLLFGVWYGWPHSKLSFTDGIAVTTYKNHFGTFTTPVAAWGSTIGATALCGVIGAAVGLAYHAITHKEAPSH